MATISIMPSLIIIGMLSSTFSSALVSMVSAPKILQVQLFFFEDFITMLPKYNSVAGSKYGQTLSSYLWTSEGVRKRSSASTRIRTHFHYYCSHGRNWYGSIGSTVETIHSRRPKFDRSDHFQLLPRSVHISELFLLRCVILWKSRYA